MRNDINTKRAQELERIRLSHGGLLKPEDVVEFAKDPNTMLHAEFTWDDSQAAHERRLDQARNVIRLVVTIISNERVEPVRAYVSLPSDRVAGNGYRAIQDVVNDKSRREEMLRDALERLQAAKRTYSRLQDLQPIWDAIDAAVEQQASSTATG